MIEKLSDGFIFLGLALVSGIVWLVRLEGSDKHNSSRIDLMQSQINAHVAKDEAVHAKMLDELSEIKETTAEIRGFLKHDK